MWAAMKEWGPALLRLAVGSVFVAHGLPKLLPIWGGSPADTAIFFESIGLQPGYPLVILVGGVEALGGLCLLAGLFTRWVAVPLLIDMAVAAWIVHVPHGFFLNWTLRTGIGHGFEFHLVLAAALLCLLFVGPGAISVDVRRARAAEAAAAGRARLSKV